MNDQNANRNGSARRWILIGVWLAPLVAVVLQWRSIAHVRQENELLRSQPSSAPATESPSQPAASAPAVSIDPAQVEQERLELLRLRNEMRQLRERLALPAADPRPVAAQPAPVPAATPAGASPGDEIRRLSFAARQGDSGALDGLAKLMTGTRTLSPEEQARVRSEMERAFDELGAEAGRGNTSALQAVWQASRLRELQGFAVQALGQAAGQGNEEALKPLLDPETYLILPSLAVSALKPAADAGNERAIQALAATAANQKQSALWLLAAQGLESAASAGNATAIDSLVALAGAENQNVKKEALLALEAAARKKQPRAEEALRKLGWR